MWEPANDKVQIAKETQVKISQMELIYIIVVSYSCDQFLYYYLNFIS